VDAGLFGQLAQRGVLQILAGVDAALRELPVERAGRAGAAAEPDLAVIAKQDHPDVGAKAGEVVGRRHRRAITAEAGASW